MALPIAANTTCDIYRAGNGPPANPDVPGVKCFLRGAYGEGLEHGETDNTALRYDHIMLVDVSVDVRDCYDLADVSSQSFDIAWVPDRNGTQFYVRFVERHGRGTSFDHKRVYLARWTPPWPTSNV
jgi:hypothetical protein